MDNFDLICQMSKLYMTAVSRTRILTQNITLKPKTGKTVNKKVIFFFFGN